MAKMNYALETITPAKAKKYLESNTRNRNLRKPWVDQLARLIREDQWHVSHQGIAFNCDGTLMDGQHRLAAIVLAGKPVEVWVARAMPKESMYAVDSGKIRPPHDIANILDLDVNINRNITGIIRMMVPGLNDPHRMTRSTLSNEDVVRAAVQHDAALRFVVAQISSNSYRHACVAAPIARAWYTVDRDRLAEFCKVFVTGMPADQRDSVAVLLRTKFLRERNTFGSHAGRLSLYGCTEYAIQKFAQRRQLMSIRSADRELFPLPGEELI